MVSNNTEDKYIKRIDQLLNKLSDPDTLGEENSADVVEGCYIGTLGVMNALYGSSSSQSKGLLSVKNAAKGYSMGYRLTYIAKSIRGILINVKEEIEGGLIVGIRSEVAGLVIGDLVALAKESLKSGYKDVAAVLAAAALEDAMKRKAEEMGVNVEGKSLNGIINSLKTKSFFKGAQVPIISSFVKLRNSAMHADWDKIEDADVSSLIGFLEPFLIKHFSGG